MDAEFRIIQYGLGPVGNEITQHLVEKSKLKIIGAIDIDPAKVGRDIGQLAGLPEPLGVPISKDAEMLLKEKKPDIVILTTTSGLKETLPQIMGILSHGVNVVTTCEELSYPWLTHRQWAGQIDEAAKSANVTVLSTGINPGFLMDFLPLTLTGVCREINKIGIQRVQNAQYRRIPFQKKIGAGLTVPQFYEKVRDKSLRHVGLTESMHMIAHKIGWVLSRTEENIEPVIAEQPVISSTLSVAPGRALGVIQRGHGYRDGVEVISLFFKATIGEPQPYEKIVIDGTPPVNMIINGGINGDIATCSIIANAIPVVINAAPGLKTMADIGTIPFMQ